MIRNVSVTTAPVDILVAVVTGGCPSNDAQTEPPRAIPACTEADESDTLKSHWPLGGRIEQSIL